jgi:hypothetical protein
VRERVREKSEKILFSNSNFFPFNGLNATYFYPKTRSSRHAHAHARPRIRRKRREEEEEEEEEEETKKCFRTSATARKFRARRA